MARIDWTQTGNRFFEAGVDRGVLYVDGNSGVPWVGLTAVNVSKSGGDEKARYLDGVKLSNYSEPTVFEGTIEAFTYPREFEPCEGIVTIQNGLRAMQQRAKPFGMVYRTKIGNDLKGLDHSYKIHVLYNLRAEASDRGYITLGEDNEPIVFSWKITARTKLVTGFGPIAYFEIDSRDVPAQLLQEIEDILYGSASNQPSLPTPGELVFLFDQFLDLVYDAGDPYTPVFATYDAGNLTTPVVETIDGGEL